ncbi:MAG: hypothetical protein CK531_01445 [Gemmatimonadetes bacterium]|nr:MAG: hypothetical protein CK531_01445 [Gemmatimonadota bacterium]
MVDTVGPLTVRPAADTGSDSTAVLLRVLTADDTIKAPLASPYLPNASRSARTKTEWNRDELFAAGALTLGELVAQVPGATLMTTGFLMAPQVVAWHGDPAAVRLFVDGIEREDVTPRNAGVSDLALFPLWALEQVSFEITPGELRVHARTWRVDRTTPYTRTDVLTGSENLNLFRGYFGKRSATGVAVQLAAQQASTASVRGLDGEGLGAMARLGWARGEWSVDATMIRQGLKRHSGVRFPQTTPVANAFPPFNGTSSMSYLRAAWRVPQGDGPWMQIVAATLGATKTRPAASSTYGSASVLSDSADTTSSRAQYTVTGGLNRGPLRLSGTARVRSADGTSDAAPAVRAEWSTGWLSVAANAGRRFGGAPVWDARGVVSPRDWLRFSGTTGVSRAGIDPGIESRAGSHVDASIRLRGRWLSVGAITLAGGAVAAPIELDTVMRQVFVPDGKAITISFSGPLIRGFQFHTEFVEWEGATTYRPQSQAKTRLWFASSFAEALPYSNFHIMAALKHEYRSRLFVPTGSDGLGQVSKASSVFGSLLEIRIASAVISWDYRNMSGTNFETFPGYLMPRITSVYGIRWEFWN